MRIVVVGSFSFLKTGDQTDDDTKDLHADRSPVNVMHSGINKPVQSFTSSGHFVVNLQQIKTIIRIGLSMKNNDTVPTSSFRVTAEYEQLQH